jgi:hypothetical protein
MHCHPALPSIWPHLPPPICGRKHPPGHSRSAPHPSGQRSDAPVLLSLLLQLSLRIPASGFCTIPWVPSSVSDLDTSSWSACLKNICDTTYSLPAWCSSGSYPLRSLLGPLNVVIGFQSYLGFQASTSSRMAAPLVLTKTLQVCPHVF